MLGLKIRRRKTDEQKAEEQRIIKQNLEKQKLKEKKEPYINEYSEALTEFKHYSGNLSIADKDHVGIAVLQMKLAEEKLQLTKQILKEIDAGIR